MEKWLNVCSAAKKPRHGAASYAETASSSKGGNSQADSGNDGSATLRSEKQVPGCNVAKKSRHRQYSEE